MNKARGLTAALSLFILFAGCSSGQPETGTPITVYTLSGTDNRSPLQENFLTCPEDAILWEFALRELFSRSPFPTGVTAEEAYVKDGVIHVTLSEEASEISGLPLTLARACIVLTMTGVDGVEAVSLTTGGQELLFRADDFILGSLVLADTEQNVTLYFSDSEGSRTASETRTLVVRETDTVDWYLNYILEALIAGPQSSSLRPVFTEGTKLLSPVAVNGTDCTVNLSKEFLTLREGISAPLALSCLFRSVTAQEGIESMTLWIDGQPLYSYFGLDTSVPLTAENADWLVP